MLLKINGKTFEDTNPNFPSEIMRKTENPEEKQACE